MKVLQINAVYGHGSTGVIVRDLERTCEQYGIDCYVASPDPKVMEAKLGYLIGNLIDHKVHALLSRINGKQAYFSSYATRRLLRYIDSIKPDIVHLHNLHSNYINLNILLKHLAKEDIHTIVTLHDCWYYTGGCFHYTNVKCQKWKHECGRCVKKKLDTIAYIFDLSRSILSDRIQFLSAIPHLTFVGCSNWITSEISKSRLKHSGNITCIYNGFDLRTFYPRPSNLKNTLGLVGKKVIIGPASKWLNPINCVELDYFAQNLPKDTVLLLFGVSSAIYDLPETIRLYGYTSNRDELAELYSMADVMVNCSREDTLSSLNLECQACGTPVVTYDATGNKETVDNISSFAVETGFAQALFDVTINILTKEKEELSVKCRKFVQDNFEQTSNYAKYIGLYKKSLLDI